MNIMIPEMTIISPGKFLMGSPENEEGRDSDEGPQHEVTISKSFAIGRYAVTFDEWDFAQSDKDWLAITKVEPRRPNDFGWGRGNRPVIDVSWDDAQAYTRWLSAKTGSEYRLPSEAEWEYAARAGTATPFWWGTSITPDQANYNGNDVYGGGKKGKYRQQTVPVESFDPNPWGLYQVHGNVWEWCADPWHEDYQGAPDDGSVWTGGGDDSARVLRGGSWINYPRFLRSTFRNKYTPGFRFMLIGFRIARGDQYYRL